MTAMARIELARLCEHELTVDLITAGRAYGISKNKAYDLARRGEFPVQVLQVGSRYRVRTSVLAADLLQQNEAAPAPTGAAPTSTIPSQEKNEVYQHDPTSSS